jgi:acyl carrier protein
VLARIWCEVLNLTQVGIHDNFFELGGHSLLATQVISRVRNIFQVEITVRALFEESTVADLAKCVDEALREDKYLAATPIVPVARAQQLPLSFAQERLWFLGELDPGSVVYNIPTVLWLDGALDVAALRSGLEEVVRRHEALRTRFETIAGRPVQVIEPVTSVEMPFIDLSTAPQREPEVMRLCREEARRPFDLGRELMLRARLFRLEPGRHALFLNLHHIAADAWSVGVLLRELGSLYEAFCQGRPSALGDLPIQYADFAVWQRDWLQGEVLEKQLGYWKTQLAGAPALLELPTDRSRPARQSYRGATETAVFPSSLLKAVKALSQQEGASLFMTLLAAFQTLLSRYTGQEDITVGSPIAGRNRMELEELIGFFLNTLVLRGDLSGNPTFRELLRRIKEVTLGAYGHQDLPFEKLQPIMPGHVYIRQHVSHADAAGRTGLELGRDIFCDLQI